MFEKKRDGRPGETGRSEDGRRDDRRAGRRPGVWIYILAFIGLAAILFLLFRYAIVPLLVMIG